MIYDCCYYCQFKEVFLYNQHKKAKRRIIMEELRTLNTTILIIEKQNKILLGKKKRGFAQGVFIGIGGKQDANETIDQTMIRETQRGLVQC